MFKRGASNEIDEIYSSQISIKPQKYHTKMTMNAVRMIKNFIQLFFTWIFLRERNVPPYNVESKTSMSAFLLVSSTIIALVDASLQEGF